MTELRTPVRNHLTQELSEERARRIWVNIGRGRTRVRARRRAAPLLALASITLVVALLLPWLRSETAPVAAPLDRVDGGTLRFLDGTQAPYVRLDDGSSIELASAAQLEVLSNHGRAFVSVLRRGRATFEVRPGGPRRWTVETGLGSVEVVGTRFTIAKDADAVEVSVSRGAVVVRAETLPGRGRRLTAGQRLRLEQPRADTRPAKRPESFSPPAASATAPASAPPATARPATAPPAPPATAVPPSFDDLLALADRERRLGDRGAAIGHLRAAVGHGTADTRRATAAFLLGKLLLESARPGEAASAFARCLQLSPPAALAEDALARSVEAEARAGHPERARNLAQAYRERYPRGSRLGEVSQWAGDAY